MKITIIICVYNTDEKYLNECLCSLREQTLFHTGVIDSEDIESEILFIDDGSTVDYSKLVKQHGVRYVKTENRGIFAARALGVELATGDYAAFCDSDDTVSFNYHLPMLLCARKHGADIVMNDWAFHTTRGRYYCDADSSISEDFELTDDSVLEKFTIQRGKEHSYYVLWNKIYSLPLLKDAIESVRSATNGGAGFSYSEDALINFFAFKKAKKIKNIHTGYYFYRIHDSQSVNVVSEQKLRSQIESMAMTLDVMSENVEPERESIKVDIDEWRKHMSRAHYSHAKAGKYDRLYPYIKEAYKVEKLTRSTLADGAAYSKNKLLGDNFTETDSRLLSIWKSGGGSVKLADGCNYAKASLDFMSELGLQIEYGSGVSIASPTIPLKKRILFNKTVYKLGMLLFKKGSKMRAFLKKRI